MILKLCTSAISLIFVYLQLSAMAMGHPFHTTIAEMEYNEQTGRYEVTLKVLTNDLEKAYQQKMPSVSEAVSLEERIMELPPSGTADRKAIEFVAQNFVLNCDALVGRVRLVGVEHDKSSSWIYFELLPPEMPRGSDANGVLVLTNRVFCSFNAGQINTVLLSTKQGKVSLKTDDKLLSIKLPQTNPSDATVIKSDK